MMLFIRKYLVFLLMGLMFSNTAVFGVKPRPVVQKLSVVNNKNQSSGQPAASMDQRPLIQQPSTPVLVKALFKRAVLSAGLMYLTMAMSYGDPIQMVFNNRMFSGAQCVVPLAVAMACHGIQQMAEKKDRLMQIRTGNQSRLWSLIESCSSVVKNIMLQSSILGVLQPAIAQSFYSVGSATANACYKTAAASPAVCSFVADKTASLGLSLGIFAAFDGVNTLRQQWDCLPKIVRLNNAPLTRYKKSAFIEQACSEEQRTVGTSSKEENKSPAQWTCALQGPQIYYFLVQQGCDIEKEWNYLLPQEKQIEAAKRGKWQSFYNKQHSQFVSLIAQAFTSVYEELPATVLSVADLVNRYMPFGQYPLQCKLDEAYLAQEKPSFSCTVKKESQAIFDGIEKAVLSYFDPKNVNFRDQKNDETIFNAPFTPIFINVNKKSNTVTITAYPQSRQDRLYPNLWQTAVKLPQWFNVASRAIPYALASGRTLLSKPTNYFLPDGKMCFVRDGLSYCIGDQRGNSTTCSSYESCMQELLNSHIQAADALKVLELDPLDIYDCKKIGKQFRKLSVKYHPDHGWPQSKIIALAEAKEFLLEHCKH